MYQFSSSFEIDIRSPFESVSVPRYTTNETIINRFNQGNWLLNFMDCLNNSEHNLFHHQPALWTRLIFNLIITESGPLHFMFLGLLKHNDDVFDFYDFCEGNSFDQRRFMRFGPGLSAMDGPAINIYSWSDLQAFLLVMWVRFISLASENVSRNRWQQIIPPDCQYYVSTLSRRAGWSEKDSILWVCFCPDTDPRDVSYEVNWQPSRVGYFFSLCSVRTTVMARAG